MKNFQPDDVMELLHSEGEWWYSLVFFSDAQLVYVLNLMGINATDEFTRTTMIRAIAQRLTESGKHIDTMRNYFNEQFLVPNDRHYQASHLYSDFTDCESQVTERLVNSEYDCNIDPQVHKDFVLDALTLEQLLSVYALTDSDPEQETREWLIEAINKINFVEEYDAFLRSSGELSSVKTEHAALIEFLFGSMIVEEEE